MGKRRVNRVRHDTQRRLLTADTIVRLAMRGLDIDRSTLSGWTGQAATFLDPIVNRIPDAVFSADNIHADDTPVPVLDPAKA